MRGRFSSYRRFIGAGAALTLCAAAFAAQDIEEQVRAVLEANRRLEEQVKAQQTVIERLSAEVAEMRGASERQARELEELQDQAATPRRSGRGEPAVRVTGEAGIAWFDTGAAGQWPNSEFRVDDAKIAVEARVWDNAFAFAELLLMPRETNEETFGLGEFYVDFEGVFGGRLGNVRAGRLNIPFGEEYLVRGVIANPLISHSVSDVWGIDEGVELYGEAGTFSYVVAVQNGGHNALHDFDADKAFAGRVGWDPARWLHVSASAMRTGDLSVQKDGMSEIWLANGFFRALGAAATTRSFGAESYELDAAVRWKTGHLAAAAGWARLDEDDTAGEHVRDFEYHFVEAVQEVGEGFFGAARYSAVRVPRGYPLAGFGNVGAYFYSPAAPLTAALRRWSLGFGYRFGPPLVLKFEYAREDGRLASGAKRDDETFLATEIGLKF